MRRFKRAEKCANEWAKWLGTIASAAVDRDNAGTKVLRRQQGAQRFRGRRVQAPATSHSPAWCAHLSIWKCEVCSKKAASRTLLLRKPCRGYGPSYAAEWCDEATTPEAHRMWRLGPWMWCGVCGGSSHSSSRLLRGACRGYASERGAYNKKWLFQGRSPYAPHLAFSADRPMRVEGLGRMPLGVNPVIPF